MSSNPTYAEAMRVFWEQCGFTLTGPPEDFEPPYLYEPLDAPALCLLDFTQSMASSRTAYPKTVRLQDTQNSSCSQFDMVVTELHPVARPSATESLNGAVVYHANPEWYGVGVVIVSDGQSPVCVRFMLGMDDEDPGRISTIDFDLFRR